MRVYRALKIVSELPELGQYKNITKHCDEKLYDKYYVKVKLWENFKRKKRQQDGLYVLDLI